MSTNSSILPPKVSEYVIINLNGLAHYARLLSSYSYITQDQRETFLAFAVALEMIRDKWAGGRGKCLSRMDIENLFKFGHLLTGRSINHYFSHDMIYDRLAKFWSCMRKIPDSAVVGVINGDSGSVQPTVPLDMEKIIAATSSSSLMIKTVFDRNNSGSKDLLDIPAILLNIIIRSEAHEYVLDKILERAKDATNDPIDIDDLLSVAHKESRMKNGRLEYVTDMRAIRDATAHARFIIENDSMGDFKVRFSNLAKGYSFNETYSRKELIFFYQDYDRMTIIHSRLLTIRSLYSYLNLYFVY